MILGVLPEPLICTLANLSRVQNDSRPTSRALGRYGYYTTPAQKRLLPLE